MSHRIQTKELEMLWRGAKSFGSSADVFTGNFGSGARMLLLPNVLLMPMPSEGIQGQCPVCRAAPARDNCHQRSSLTIHACFVNSTSSSVLWTLGPGGDASQGGRTLLLPISDRMHASSEPSHRMLDLSQPYVSFVHHVKLFALQAATACPPAPIVSGAACSNRSCLISRDFSFGRQLRPAHQLQLGVGQHG